MKKRDELPLGHLKIRHWLHFVCGAASAFCFVPDPQLGWATLLGFHAYEAWQDYYFHDGGFRDIWEFWVVFIPCAVVISILKLKGVV